MNPTPIEWARLGLDTRLTKLKVVQYYYAKKQEHATQQVRYPTIWPQLGCSCFLAETGNLLLGPFALAVRHAILQWLWEISQARQPGRLLLGSVQRESVR